MANRTAVAAGSTTAKMIDGNGVPVCSGGGVGGCIGPLQPGDTLVDGSGAPIGGSGPAFPVGSVFIAVVSTDPATLLGYGTWSAFGAGRVLFVISGQMANSTVNDGATVDLRTGTGSAPANAAAVTGTQRGQPQTATSLVAAQKSGFSISAVVTGLTLATAVWFDVSLLAVTGGTATVTGLTATAMEFD